MDFLHAAYAGEMSRDGHRGEGLGQYLLPTGDLYLGEMKDGYFHGSGILFFRNKKYSTISLFEDEEEDARARRAGEGDEDLSDFLDRHNALMDAEKNRVDGIEHDAEAGAAAVPETGTAEARGGGIMSNFKGRRIKEKGSFPADYWGGLYRGVWAHGTVQKGCYVFADGLVYSAQDFTGDSHHGENRKEGWPYCRTEDRRIWAEHLKNITPVLPQESLLGFSQQAGYATYSEGEFLQSIKEAAEMSDEDKKKTQEPLYQNKAYDPLLRQSRMDNVSVISQWSRTPFLAPSSLQVATTPPAFAEGQPRGGHDILLFPSDDGGEGGDGGNTAAAGTPKREAIDAELKKRILYFLSLPTPQLEPETDENDALDEAYREMRENKKRLAEGGFNFGGFHFRDETKNAPQEEDNDNEEEEFQVRYGAEDEQGALNTEFSVEKDRKVASSALGIVPGVSVAVENPNFNLRLAGTNRVLVDPDSVDKKNGQTNE